MPRAADEDEDLTCKDCQATFTPDVTVDSCAFLNGDAGPTTPCASARGPERN